MSDQPDISSMIEVWKNRLKINLRIIHIVVILYLILNLIVIIIWIIYPEYKPAVRASPPIVLFNLVFMMLVTFIINVYLLKKIPIKFQELINSSKSIFQSDESFQKIIKETGSDERIIID